MLVFVLFLVAAKVVAVLLVAAADERRVDVDQVLDAQAGVDELLDLLDADLVHVAGERELPWFAISSIILRLVLANQ